MNSSAKQILIGWIYRRSGFLKRGMKKQIKPLAAILRFLDFSIPSYRHFECSREIFLALCSFLLLSQNVSPFPLSHIRRYTSVQERYLDFARDDVMEVSTFQTYPLYTTWNRPIPPYRHFERSEKSSLHSALSCSFRKRFSPFPLSHMGRYTSMQERSLHFGRDDNTGIELSKHIRCTLLEINPFPPYCHFERSEKSSLHSALSCSFRKRFPFFRCLT